MTDEAARWHARFGVSKDDRSPERMWCTKYGAYFEEKKHAKMIDLGCGGGIHSCYFLEQGYDVTACDASDAAAEVVRARKPAIPFLQFDMSKGLPFAPQSLGLVFASLSIHYFTLEDTKKLLANIHSVLENGGYFLFKVNSYKEFSLTDKGKDAVEIEKDYYRSPNGEVRRYFTLESMAALLTDFNIVSLEEGGFQYKGKTKYTVEGVAQKSS